MDDNNTSRMQEADTKAESPSKLESPKECMEHAGSYCVAQVHSPPLNTEGEKESKSPSKVVRMLSFHRGISKSLRERSTKDPAILRSSKRFSKRSSTHIEEHAHDTKENSSVPEESGKSEDNSIKTEPLSEHKKSPSGSPEKSAESKDSCWVAQLNPPPLNDGGEKTTSPSKPLATVLNFSRGFSQSVKEMSMKEPGILRSSKRFANKSFKWIENRVHAHKENTEESEEPEDDYIKKEPLSVMEINKLIQMRQLLEAFEHTKNLETELLAERDTKKYEDNPKEDAMKAKDVDLLYDHISKVIQEIVQETLDHPSLDEKAVTSLVTLIEAEEKAHPEAMETAVSFGPIPLGSARNWRELWKEAVNQSVNQRVRKVPISLRDDNEAWFSVHLGFLRTVIKEDLLKIKLQGHKCYPQDYNVCDTYMGAFHKALSSHLHDILEENSLTFREFYALLNWITNIYHSEEFLGHPDLKPEINAEDLPDLLTPEAMDKLRNDYINSLKEQTKMCLDNILMLQTKRNWNSEEQPEVLQIQDHSLFSLDIQMMIGQHMKASEVICDSLKTSTLEISLKEVTEFMPRFEKTFLEWDKEHDLPRFVECMVININDSHDLLTGLEKNFSISCQELEKALNDVVLRYQKHFLHKLRLKTQPLFKQVLSGQWILHSGTPDSFIMKALSVTEEFSEPLIHLKKPFYKQDFLNGIHKYVVKEYITQTLKSKGRRRRRKWEEISKLMKQEAAIINDAMIHLGSSSDWLFPAIPHIADILGEKKKRNVKDCLTNLSQDYPDIRREHVLALLALRGWWRATRQAMADQINKLADGLETGSDRTLFAEIELPNTIQCF